MKKTVCVCDHCKTEFNPMNGYSDLDIDDFVFVKKIDLCTDCFYELCNIVREYIGEDLSK